MIIKTDFKTLSLKLFLMYILKYYDLLVDCILVMTQNYYFNVINWTHYYIGY